MMFVCQGLKGDIGLVGEKGNTGEKGMKGIKGMKVSVAERECMRLPVFREVMLKNVIC